MEILNKLNKTTTKSKRRLGRGIGSGNGGHTVGRGAKGDKARGKNKLTFDGQKIKKSWIKRLPFLRGKHRTLKRNETMVLNLNHLEKWFKKDEVVDLNSISKKIKLSPKDLIGRIKILSDGELTKALTIKNVLVSKDAAKKIIAAGGNID
ncbi:MAG: 50S ribosomal protein L15 [Candidatus Shapirobacteria bacterium]